MEDSFIKITKTKPRADQINLLGVLSYILLNTVNGKYCCNGGGNMVKCSQYGAVSIPQAVSTVATPKSTTKEMKLAACFNTASGKYCCNIKSNDALWVAANGFNTASGKYCCNRFGTALHKRNKSCFNTASGKYCCNICQ